MRAGDRVALVLKNRPEYVIAYFATARAGCIIVPINRRASATEVVRIVTDSDAKILITETGYEELAAAVCTECPATMVTLVGGPADDSFETLLQCGSSAEPFGQVADTDVQSIHYTSGTTGTAKGVVRTHHANSAVIRGAIAATSVGPGDAWLNTLPLNSVGVYAFALPALVRQATLLLTENVDADLTVDLVNRYRVAMLHAVPTVWEMLMRSNAGRESNQLSSVRSAFWGGSPLPRGTAERLEDWMATPALGVYGSSEAPCISYSTCDIYRSGRRDSSGPLIAGMEAKVVDDDGVEVPAGTMGEVRLRGDALMQEYFNRPDLTRSVFTHDGWYITGDWGRIDEDGAVTVTDRKKDMIISGGENIYPGEVENVISELPGVSEVAVVGVPDDLWGQAVWAFVSGDGTGPQRKDVVAACRAVLAAYKTPRRVVFVDDMPKNATGKIVKSDLVAQATGLLASESRVQA